MSSHQPDPQQERELFEQAVELPLAARGPFLDSACGSDAALRRRIDALLLAAETEDGFLPDMPAGTIAAGVGAGSLLEKEGDCIGRYHLLEKIGEGGCGIVFMAEQRAPMRRRVALKILKPGLDTKGVVARFEAERQALALMDHPNIARVLDGGTTGTGRPFFVMELVRGIRITEFCDEKKYSPRERLEVFVQVCQAIQHAHQKGIIHRDLKPSNILVTVNDGVPVPKVIDFGIAKATGQQLTDKTLFTHFHALVGTPAYMSPEQAEFSSLDVDTRTDVYSLGVLLYELLVGRTPFDSQELLAAGWDALRRTLRDEEPVRPSTRLRTLSGQDLTRTATRRRREVPQLVSELQGDLDWIVLKCLEKDRGRRYDSVGALAQDVVRHLRDEPIVARPPTLAYRLQKTFQRNRLACTAGALVAVTLVVASGFSIWTMLREKAARALAEQQSLRANRETTAARAAERAARQAAYAADMQAAELALKDHNPGRAQTLLAAYIPKAGEEDLRGIEWRWLWHANRDQSIATLPHPGLVHDLLVAPDGRWFASVCLDGKVRIWDAGSLRLLTEFTAENPGQGAVSPDGTLLALSTANATVVRETRNWQVVRSLPDLREPLVFGQDGLHLYGAERGKFVRWRPFEGTREELPFPLKDDQLQYLATLGRDQLVAGSYASQAGVAMVSTSDGSVVRRLAGHDELIAVAGSPDGRWVVAGDRWGKVALWDAASGEMTGPAEGPVSAHSLLANRLAFSPDSTRLATVGGDQQVRLWQLPTSTEGQLEELASFRGHANAVEALAFAPAGARLFSGAKDATARVWSLAGIAARRPKSEADPGPGIFGLSPDGRQIITGAAEGNLRWWAADGHRLLREQRLPFGPDSMPLWAGAGFIFAPDRAGKVIHWDSEADGGNGAERWQASLGPEPVRPLAFATNGAWLAVGEHSPVPRLHLFQLPGTEPLVTLTDYAGRPGLYSRPAALSPDGRWLAYPGPGFSVILWDVQTRQSRHTLKGMRWHLYALAFSADGTKLAASGFEGTVCLWDCADGALRLGPFLAHGVEANHVEFSADGRTLLTTAEGGSLRLWNAANGRQMLTFPDAESTAGALLSADNRRLIYWDKATYKVVVMDLPEAEEPRPAAPRP
jgi:serine/threonine protein kinase/WD40 repeat protein